jgi:hypothetical protein
MKRRSLRTLHKLRWLVPGGLLLQQGCPLDPDLAVNAVFQLLTEFAIYFTDAALVSVR